MFNHSDLVCKHCEKLGNNSNANKLLCNLNEFQTFLGPAHLIRINSAYRCKEYNRTIYKKIYRVALTKKTMTEAQVFRKADSSQHPRNLAADIKILYYNPEMMRKRAKEFNRWHAIGIYSWGIHVDIRKIPIVTWDNRPEKRKKLFKIDL